MIQNRPGHFFKVLRCYVLFYWARFCRSFYKAPGVNLAENVRLQKNSSLMAESPNASISIAQDSIIYEDAKIEAYKNGKISIGRSSIIGEARIFSRYNVQIGSHFLSSWNVFIQDYDSHPTDPATRRQQVENMTSSFKPRFDLSEAAAVVPLDWDFPGEAITIGDDVWVGAGATILKGAKIGSGSIVASGAIVRKGDYPPKSLLAGNPAVVVKQL